MFFFNQRLSIAESTRGGVCGCVCVFLGEVDALNEKRAKLLLLWHEKDGGVRRVGSASSRVLARYDTAKEQDFDVRALLFVYVCTYFFPWGFQPDTLLLLLWFVACVEVLP